MVLVIRLNKLQIDSVRQLNTQLVVNKIINNYIVWFGFFLNLKHILFELVLILQFLEFFYKFCIFEVFLAIKIVQGIRCVKIIGKKCVNQKTGAHKNVSVQNI